MLPSYQTANFFPRKGLHSLFTEVQVKPEEKKNICSHLSSLKTCNSLNIYWPTHPHKFINRKFFVLKANRLSGKNREEKIAFTFVINMVAPSQKVCSFKICGNDEATERGQRQLNSRRVRQRSRNPILSQCAVPQAHPVMYLMILMESKS